MRAAIDIGSNSIRLLFCGTTRSDITQLALGINDTNKLNENGVAATLDALARYVAICRENGCTEIIAFATEAVRRADDGKAFCETVKQKLDLNIALLSPEQEARLALLGAEKPHGAITVCDLGGGSMELISSNDGKHPDYIKSLPLGVVVLKNMFNGNYRRAIDELPALVSGYGRVPNRPVVLCGGSACTIAAAILNLKTYDKAAVTTKFKTHELDDIMPILLSSKLTVFRPICARRADTLPYGAIALQAVLNHVGATEFFVSDASNLEAVVEYGI